MNKNLLKSISIIIGTLIGAGFASGKEIYIFFMRYGKFGLLGIIVSTILTICIINNVIKITKKNNIKNNNEFINVISTNTKINIFLKNIVNIFLLISFFIMVAGFSAYFKQEFNVPIIISSLIISIIIYYTFMKNIEGIIKLCSIIVPILIVIMAYIIFNNFCNQNDISQTIYKINNSGGLIFYAILSGILYTSYNSIILIPIIISISHYIKEKEDNTNLLIITGIILVTLTIGICNVLRIADFNIEYSELPILQILNKQKMQKLIYSVVVVVAIFTSALSAGYGILENIKNKKTYKIITLMLCSTSIPISYIGFGNLVSVLYPIFGLIGIIQIVLIFIKAKQDKFSQ